MSPSSWAAGREVGSYRLERRIGVGGMGEVWSAVDVRLGRRVAIKRLLDDMRLDADVIARFEREARMQAQLSSDHIATLHGIERRARDDGGHDIFLVMELVEGKSLRSILERGALPLDETIQLFTQLAMALSVAHGAGVVHRDLKPSNLIVRDDGTLVVVDFGIALQPEAEDSGEITATGTVIGSAAYMSPQQAAGERVGPEADVWSAGVTLFEMLTGERPFGGDNVAELVAAIVRDHPPDLRELRPEVPRALSDLVARCLSKDPTKRPQDGGELLELVPAVPIPLAGSRKHTLDPKLLARGAVHPPLSRAGRIAAVVAVVLAVVLCMASSRSLLSNEAPWPPPAEGELQARTLLTDLGLNDTMPHHAGGFIAGRGHRAAYWARFGGAGFYTHRQPPTLFYPPPLPGEIDIQLTFDGRLRRFDYHPGDEPPPEDMLSTLLAAAAIRGPVAYQGDVAYLRGAPLRHGIAADGTALRIAELDGRVIHLSRNDMPKIDALLVGLRVPDSGKLGGFFVMLAVVALAWVQWRKRRGDAEGALVCGGIVVVTEFMKLLPFPEMLVQRGWAHVIAWGTAFGVLTMLAYYGLEPMLRRRWPGMLVGWERLIHWQSGDHVLGRELLLGCAGTLALALAVAIQVRLGVREVPLRELTAVAFSSPGRQFVAVLSALEVGLFLPLFMLLWASLFRVVVRVHAIALVLAALLFALIAASLFVHPLLLVTLAVAATLTWLLYRAGLVAVMTFFMASYLLAIASWPAFGGWTLPFTVAPLMLLTAIVVLGVVWARRIPKVATRTDTAVATTEVDAGADTRVVQKHQATEELQPDSMPSTVRDAKTRRDRSRDAS